MSRSLRRVAALLLAPVLWVVGCTGGSNPSHPSNPSNPANPPARPTSVAAQPVPPTPEVSRPEVVPPPAGAVFDYQIGGAYPPAADVRIVDRDRTESPASGRYNICYVNALQTQSDEPGQSTTAPPYGTTSWWALNHPRLLVHDRQGRLVVDPDWDEAIFDVSTAANRTALLAIQQTWLDGCRRKGFQAVEPDNMDSYDRSQGRFGFAADKAYLIPFTRYAHSIGLAVAQKNANGEFGATGRSQVGFDFAIAEECSYYGECPTYTSVYGAHVIEIEYTDEPRSAFLRSCSVRGGRVSVIRRDRDVVPRGAPGYSYRLCP